MGSFIGHAIPGSFFFFYGVWCVIMTLRRHFLCRHTRRPFHATATYPCPFPLPLCLNGRMRDFPVESVVKMALTVMGAIVEVIGGTNHVTHRFDSIGNAQHITMYFFFGLTGVLDILVHKDIAPAASDYVGMMVALLVEGALFKFHLFGRDVLDVLLHTLLLYVIGFSVLVVGLEAAFRKSTVLPVLRGSLLMLQGTWFWGVGYILYNPFPGARPWDPSDHHALMLAVVCFSWHVAANLLLVIAMGGVTGCCYRQGGRGSLYYSKLNEMPMDEEHEKDEELALLVVGGGGGKGRGGGVGGEATTVFTESGEAKKGARSSLVQDEDLSDLEFEAPVSKGIAIHQL